MLVCWDWLAADYLVRACWSLTTRADGTRQARRGRLTIALPPVCGHEDCPPHPTTLSRDRAA